MSLKDKIRLGYVIAFILLMISYFLIFRSVSDLQKEYDDVTHSYAAANKINQLNNLIVEAETRVRGYYVTGDPEFLATYSQNINKIPGIYEELRILSSDDEDQLAKLGTIRALIDRRINIMKDNISSFEGANKNITGQMNAASVSSKQIMDSLALHVEDFTRNVENTIATRKNKLSSFFGSTQLVIIASVLMSVLAILYSLYTYNKESAAKNESAKKSNQYQKELEKKIEELKAMDSEVRELRSMEKFTTTGRIARTIAHEVRNPLTNISLAAEQLQEMAGQNQESTLLLDMINRNSVRINQLVADLLNATKVLELELQTVNINCLLDESLEMAIDRINLNNIKVEKHYSAEVCDVPVDPSRIRIAFLNIIVNAIEAMEKNQGVLTLKTKRETTKCIIEISDNGTGMDEETIQKLFEPYFTQKSRGNGLGLTNSQNIILTHRGKIDIQSKPGNGTVFKITLNF